VGYSVCTVSVTSLRVLHTPVSDDKKQWVGYDFEGNFRSNKLQDENGEEIPNIREYFQRF
jgi:hypothetical protein